MASKLIVDLYREVEATVSVQVGPEEAAEEVEPAVAVNESVAVESEEVVPETETEKAETTE